MWLTFQLLLNGIATGALYALLGIGFALIYNGTRILHLAHGAVFALGAYVLFICKVWFHLPLVVGFVLSGIAAAALGIAMEVFVYRPLRKRNSSDAALLVASLGMLTFFQAVFGICFGTDTLNIDQEALATYSLGNLIVTQLHVLIAVVASVVFPVLHFFLVRTRYGRAIRALSDNPQLALIYGVNTRRLYIVIFAIGSVLAALAAGLMSFDSGIRPTVGISVMFIALVAVIVGGVGYLPGAAAGGMIVGLLQSMALLPLSARWQEVVVFGLVMVLLVVRPQGLFGHFLAVRRA